MGNLISNSAAKPALNGSWTALEACQVHEKLALERSAKSTKYELEGSYDDPVHERFSFLKTAKLPPECNEGASGLPMRL